LCVRIFQFLKLKRASFIYQGSYFEVELVGKKKKTTCILKQDELVKEIEIARYGQKNKLLLTLFKQIINILNFP